MDLAQAESKMCRLTKDQLNAKINFITNYIESNNAADGSIFDANSNVSSKNVATMVAELNKDINIQIERRLIYNMLVNKFGSELADKYIDQLEKHEIYCHDETMPMPYCVAISMYPFLERGLKDFGGDTVPPKHLSSFNGGFINLIFAVASQFCGAVATPEYLMYFDYFARKEYGNNYLESNRDIILQELQSVVYALNQPASARNYQSVFWNISIFDYFYFDSLFSNFRYPDGSAPDWNSVDKLQRAFMKYFNEERTKALLTFPVITVSLFNNKEEILDKEYEEFVCEELSRGNAFFIYTSDSIDSLSSCCRLRNYIGDQLKNDFSYSLGAGGVMTGSMNVLTLNMNRFIQDTAREFGFISFDVHDFKSYLLKKLREQIFLMHKYQIGFKLFYKKLYEANMLPAYTGHYIELDKQYLTIGINGLTEGMEYLGFLIDNNNRYKNFVSDILATIAECNKQTTLEYPELKLKFNTECVPAENLGVKFAKWDKKDGYKVPRDCYNSYFYIVEDDHTTVFDKLAMQGGRIAESLDGGSACHINLEETPDKEVFRKIITAAVKEGCPYFCFNVKVTCCNDCGYIDKRTLTNCSRCGSFNVDYATRVIGYLRKVSNFSKERQSEEKRRAYTKC